MRYAMVAFLVLLAGCPKQSGMSQEEWDVILAARHKKAEDYVASHPQMAERFKRGCRTATIYVGMTAEDVRGCIDDPSYVNSSTNRAGRHEQWVYPGDFYVYLDNDVVSAVQARRGGSK